MKVENITIIGTSHIARQSLEEVRSAIESLQPKIVAVELDQGRALALLKGEKSMVRWSDIRRIGVKGFLFALIGSYVERKLGDLVGMRPGQEMLLAIQLAQKSKARVALVDQDISITLKRFSDALTWREKGRIISDILKAAVLRKKALPFDLSKVPEKEVIRHLTMQLKTRYPSIYRVLIAERNEVISSRLAVLSKQYPDSPIVVVLGAGHVEEVAELIAKKSKKAINPKSA